MVFLWLPMNLRIERLLRRERELYAERILAGGDMATDHAEFMAWTRGYDAGTAEGTNTLACQEELLRSANCPVLRITEPLTEEEALRRILAHVASPPQLPRA